jgi:hypothetical protein
MASFHENVEGAMQAMKIDGTDESPADANEGAVSPVNDGYGNEEDIYFDSSIPANGSFIPEGGRLNFVKIGAVGNAVGADGNKYSIFYLDVQCNVANPSTWTVYRRYSQFRQLSHVLRSEGYHVPVLPPKKLIGAMQLEFVRKRKAELEQWMILLVTQPELHPGAKDPQQQAYFRQFLTEGINTPPETLERVFPKAMEAMVVEDASDNPDAETSRASNKKVSLEDFDLIRVIGKGSFGKVTLVKKKTDQNLYAMKVLVKANVQKRKQVEHTRTERRVLGTVNHPFIVRLHYAFQVSGVLPLALTR